MTPFYQGTALPWPGRSRVPAPEPIQPPPSPRRGILSLQPPILCNVTSRPPPPRPPPALRTTRLPAPTLSEKPLPSSPGEATCLAPPYPFQGSLPRAPSSRPARLGLPLLRTPLSGSVHLRLAEGAQRMLTGQPWFRPLGWYTPSTGASQRRDPNPPPRHQGWDSESFQHPGIDNPPPGLGFLNIAIRNASPGSGSGATLRRDPDIPPCVLAPRGSPTARS